MVGVQYAHADEYVTSGEGSLLGLAVVGFSVGDVLIGLDEGSPLGGRVLNASEHKGTQDTNCTNMKSDWRRSSNLERDNAFHLHRCRRRIS